MTGHGGTPGDTGRLVAAPYGRAEVRLWRSRLMLLDKIPIDFDAKAWQVVQVQ
jgi:hypothetical protein